MDSFFDSIGGIYEQDGRVNVHAIAVALGIDFRVLEQALLKTTGRFARNPTTDNLQTSALRLIGVLEELTHYCSSWRSAVAWMHKPHPDLDNFTPIQVIEDGKLNVVADLVRAISTGQPG